MTYELSMKEFKMEIFHLSGGNLAQSERNITLFREGLLDPSKERRQQARSQLAANCKGQCHDIPGMGDTFWMPEKEQRKLGYLALSGAALTIINPGASLSALATSNHAIRLALTTQSLARTTIGTARATGQMTWIVTSDMASKAVIAASPITLNPSDQQQIIDFSVSLFPGAPAPSPAGFAGGFIGSAVNPHEHLR